MIICVHAHLSDGGFVTISYTAPTDWRPCFRIYSHDGERTSARDYYAERQQRVCCTYVRIWIWFDIFFLFCSFILGKIAKADPTWKHTQTHAARAQVEYRINSNKKKKNKKHIIRLRYIARRHGRLQTVWTTIIPYNILIVRQTGFGIYVRIILTDCDARRWRL